MHVAYIKHTGMRPGAHLCVTHRASEQALSKLSKLSKFRPSARLGSVACMLGSACLVAHSGRSGSARFGRAADWAAWARFDYSPVWHRLKDKKSQAAAQIQKLTTIQRLAMKAICGCYRMTSTATMSLETELPFPRLHLQQKILKTTIHMQTLSANN